MFYNKMQTLMALHSNISRQHRKCFLNLLHIKRTLPVSCSIHGTKACRKARPEISSEPIKFTSSAANISSKLKARDVNEYQGLIVYLSLFVFMVYFCYLREENDLDEMLYKQIPVLEEAQLAQSILLMKKDGLDTKDAEARLKELVDQRLSVEKRQK